MLPDLSRLRLDRAAGATSKSWAWSAGSYSVLFSIDTAIQEQIDGLETALEALARNPDALRRADGELAGSLSVTQMTPLELLRTLLEYTVQRLWDQDCALPALKLPLTAKWSGRNAQGSDGALLEAVAKCVVRIYNTAIPKSEGYEDEGEEEGEEEGEDTEDEGEGEGEEEGEETEDEAIKTEYASLWAALNAPRAAHEATRATLQRTLVDIAAAIEEAERTSRDSEELDARAEVAARAIVENRDAWTTPSIRDVRRLPPAEYYRPRLVRSARYIRWLKTHLLLFEGDEVDKEPPFEPSVAVPATLDGSFYSGLLYPNGKDGASFETRIKALHYDHVVPISHFKTASLVREFGDVLHLAFNSVFAFSSENSTKGNRFLPLTLSDTKWDSMASGEGTPVYTPEHKDRFEPARRLFAARAVCATHLSVCLLERGADGHTEMGQRRGGFYAEKSRSVEAFEMATNASLQGAYKDDDQRTAALSFERTLALVQWYYLAQPYNPMAEVAFRAHEQSGGDARAFDPTWFYYEQLLFARFSSIDRLSELVRLEMREEVAFAPGAAEALATADERRAARERMAGAVPPPPPPPRSDKRPLPQTPDAEPRTTRRAVEEKRAPEPPNPLLREGATRY